MTTAAGQSAEAFRSSRGGRKQPVPLDYEAADLIARGYRRRAFNELAYAYLAAVGSFLGLMAALWLVVLEGGVRPFYLWLAVAGFLVTGFGVSVGYHRYFSHHAFGARHWFAVLLALLGTAAGQGNFFRWINDHRIHHSHADRPGDPHSPFWYGARRLAFWHGLLHAHVLWLFRRREPLQGRLIADVAADRTMVRIDRHSAFIVVVGLLLPGGLALVCDEPTPLAFAKGLLWGGFVRMFLVNHLTWAVDSIGHTFGYRVHGVSGNARNHPILGVVGFGDGWHANHHAAPASSRHGWSWYELDLNYLMLRTLQGAGIVTTLRQPPRQSLPRS